jgi:hypothetical protein
MAARAKPQRPLALVASTGDVDANGDIVDESRLDDALKERLRLAIVAPSRALAGDQLRLVLELLRGGLA